MGIRTVTKVGSSGGAATVNAKGLATAGFKANSRLTLTPSARVGFAANAGRATLKSSAKSGFAASPHNTGTLKPAAASGGKVVRISIDLVSTQNANAVVQTAVGARSDWTVISNATGAPDSDGAAAVPTNCSKISGAALNATGGRLDLDYPNFINKTNLTITQVQLKFHVRQTGTALNNGNLIIKWSKDATINTLETITGDIDNINAAHTIPRIYTLSPIPSWADLDALKAYVEFSLVAGAAQALISAWVDAVQLVVTANTTQVP